MVVGAELGLGAWKVVRSILDGHVLGSSRTRSELEERFLGICAEARLPAPRVNTMVEGLMVDFFWPGHGVIAEVDGRRYHDHPSAHDRDRIRDQRLVAAGFTPLRFPARQVFEDPNSVRSTLKAVLAARSNSRR